MDTNKTNNEITTQDWAELNQWLTGSTEEMPDFLKVQSTDMMTKIAFSTNYIVNASIQRAIRLQTFILKAEQELYSDENLLKMEPEAIHVLYKEAVRNLAAVQNTINNHKRFNKDLLQVNDVTTDALRDKLLSLPKDKILKLLELLQNSDI